MDLNTILTAGATTTVLGGIGWLAKAIYDSRNDSISYDRAEKKRLEDSIEKVRADCAAQVKEKDGVISTQNTMIDNQNRIIRDLVLKITALLIKFTQIEGYEKIRKDVEELEKELKQERYNP